MRGNKTLQSEICQWLAEANPVGSLSENWSPFVSLQSFFFWVCQVNTGDMTWHSGQKDIIFRQASSFPFYHRMSIWHYKSPVHGYAVCVIIILLYIFVPQGERQSAAFCKGPFVPVQLSGGINPSPSCLYDMLVSDSAIQEKIENFLLVF